MGRTPLYKKAANVFHTQKNLTLTMMRAVLFLALVFSASAVWFKADETNCQGPADGTYVTTICLEETKRLDAEESVTADCTPPAAGEYLKSQADGCQQIAAWSEASPMTGWEEGKDATYHICTPPPTGMYVSAPCESGTYIEEGKDTEFLPCSETPVGYLLKIDCNPGSISSVGRDAIFEEIEECMEPGPGQYVVRECIEADKRNDFEQTEFMMCSSPVDYEFTYVPCKPGSSKEIGENTKIMPCSYPSDGNKDPEEWVVETCKMGTFAEKGTDTDAELCSVMPDGSYLNAECFPGDPLIYGADTKWTKCSMPPEGMWTSTPCVTGEQWYFGERMGSDTVFSTCGTCDAITERVVPAEGDGPDGSCVAGSWDAMGSDTQCESCGLLDGVECDGDEACCSGYCACRNISQRGKHNKIHRRRQLLFALIEKCECAPRT